MNLSYIFKAKIACLLIVCLFLATDSLAESPSDKKAKTTAKPIDTPQPSPDSDAEKTLDEVLEGHSEHGEAFNEGPRQNAYLMEGTGKIHFPVTTDSPLAQKYIDQGVGQLHGFWFLEAERSFRAAADLDPNCAMAYWGAAWAAQTDLKRARGFIAEAMQRKDKCQKKDQMHIEALNNFLAEKPDKKSDRAAAFLKALEDISIEFPNDVETKAFVAHRVWQNGRDGVPVTSYLAVDALLQQIFDADPLHPAHHYSIHLWDRRKPERALLSAAKCGESAPGIAHMWHMPGHIYSNLQRFEDAIYQQEASARVDHAHMIRDQVLPDQIHNFAHNNEWLIRNLAYVGRVHDAIDLAKNMIELPRHPKYNQLEKSRGSAQLGRMRLLRLLREYQQFDMAIDLCRSSYLGFTDVSDEKKIESLRLLGCAAAITNQSDALKLANVELDQLATDKMNELQQLEFAVGRLKAVSDTGKDQPPRAFKPEGDRKQTAEKLKEHEKTRTELKARIDQIKKSRLSIVGYGQIAARDFVAAHRSLEKATGEDLSYLGELQCLGGDVQAGMETVTKQVERRPQEVIPLARLAFLQFEFGDREEAKTTFEKLRKTSHSMDLDVELFARLQSLAADMNLSADWRSEVEPASDLGYRPELDSLGPFRWSPPPASQWSLIDANELTVGSREFAGRPHLVIFYLGHGCLHCAEQLEAFAPRVSDFQDAGIEMIAISTDDQKGLQESIESFDGEMKIRLASNEKLDVFKKFRAFDDFEDKPLHGTFLIDGNGDTLWYDIGFEPFMDHEFLLKESQRLLDGKRIKNVTATSTDVSSK